MEGDKLLNLPSSVSNIGTNGETTNNNKFNWNNFLNVILFLVLALSIGTLAGYMIGENSVDTNPPVVAPVAPPPPPPPPPTVVGETYNPTAAPTNSPTVPPTLTPTLAHCVNSVKDNDESDIDCGGNDCLACADGQTCNHNDDCSTNSWCNTNTCTANTDSPTTPPPTKSPTMPPSDAPTIPATDAPTVPTDFCTPEYYQLLTSDPTGIARHLNETECTAYCKTAGVDDPSKCGTSGTGGYNMNENTDKYYGCNEYIQNGKLKVGFNEYRCGKTGNFGSSSLVVKSDNCDTYHTCA